MDMEGFYYAYTLIQLLHIYKILDALAGFCSLFNVPCCVQCDQTNRSKSNQCVCARAFFFCSGFLNFFPSLLYSIFDWFFDSGHQYPIFRLRLSMIYIFASKQISTQEIEKKEQHLKYMHKYCIVHTVSFNVDDSYTTNQFPLRLSKLRSSGKKSRVEGFVMPFDGFQDIRFLTDLSNSPFVTQAQI